MRLLNGFLSLCAAGSLMGCMHTLKMAPEALLDTNRIVANLKTLENSRPRMSGRFKVKASGIKQFLGSVDVIFAVQKPSSFYLSVPSFFGNPARVVSSDGIVLYVLDLSTGETGYFTKPSTAETLQEWLGLKLEPKDLVGSLLANVNLDGAALIDARLTQRNKRYVATFRYEDARRAALEFDSDSDDLLSVSVTSEMQTLSYRVGYDAYKEEAGQRFPHEISLHIKSGAQSFDLVLTAAEIVFDQGAFDSSTFQIEEP